MWHWHLFLNSEQRFLFVTMSAYNWVFFNITIPLHSFFFNCWYSYNNDITRFILTRSRWFISRLQPYFPKFLWVLRTMPAHLSSPFIVYRTVSSNSRSLQQSSTLIILLHHCPRVRREQWTRKIWTSQGKDPEKEGKKMKNTGKSGKGITQTMTEKCHQT